MIHCWNSFLLSLFHFCTTSSSMDGGAWVLLSFPIRWSLPDVWKAGKRRRCHKRRWRDRISKKRRVQTGKSSIWLKNRGKEWILLSFISLLSPPLPLLIHSFEWIWYFFAESYCLTKHRRSHCEAKNIDIWVNIVKVGGDWKRKNSTWKMYLARMTLFCSLPQTQR